MIYTNIKYGSEAGGKTKWKREKQKMLDGH